MSKAIHTIILLLFLIPAAALSEEAEPAKISEIIPGSDEYTVQDCGNIGSFTYKGYVVYIVPSIEFHGNSIYVYKPEAVDKLCDPSVSEAYFYLKAGEYGGSNVFAGLYGDLLFIDQWPGRNYKRLLIFDLKSKSLLLVSAYVDPRIDGDVLYYKRTLKARKSVVKDIPCPNAEKWKEEGQTVLYTEKMKFDLTDRRKEGTLEYGCQSAAPIKGAKKGMYGN